MGRQIIVLLATIVFVTYANVLQAQQTARRWSFALGVANPAGHAQTDAAELAMRQAHFDATEPGACVFGFICWGPEDHPGSKQGGSRATFSVQYQVSNKLALKGHGFSSRLGSTDGYHADHEEISVGTKVSGYGLLASTTFLGVLNVSAGPAYITALAQGPEQSYKAKRLALVVEGSARFPARSTFFVELQFQRRLIGSARVGPFTPTTAWPYGGPSVRSVPAFRQQLSHGVFGVGTGFRL